MVSGKILKKWRGLKLPIIHIRHSSKNPFSKLHKSKPGFEFNDFVKPINDEIVITKKVNSAFIGIQFKILIKNKINALVFVGIDGDGIIIVYLQL